MAKPDFEFRDWLAVKHLGQTYDARKKHLRSRWQAVLDFVQRETSLARWLADLEEEIDVLLERDRMLGAAKVSITFEAQLNRFPLAAHPFAGQFLGHNYYQPPVCPSGATEVVSRSQARRLVREWDKELAAVRKALAVKRAKAGDVRRNIATAGPGHAQLMERFERVEKNVMGQ